MRSFFILLSILCHVIGGLLVISIPLIGVLKVFSLFPEWVYIILFLGVIIPYIINEDKKNEAINKQQQERKESAIVTEKKEELQLASKDDDKIENLNIQRLNDSGTISEILRLNPFIVASDNNIGLIKEVTINGTQKGIIKLCQQKMKYNIADGSKQIIETRFAFLMGDLEKVHEIINKHDLKIGSQISGKIILVESLAPSWKGHKSKIDIKTGKPIGFTFPENQYPFRDRLYPVYEKYIFVDDTSTCDYVMNYSRAKDFFKDYDLEPGDILPF